MLYLDVIQSLENQLTDPNVTRSFMQAVEIRQRLFRQNRANACILDPYDMFSDHVMIRRRADHRIVSYLRVTSMSECRKHELPYPLENLEKESAGLAEPLAEFLNCGKEPLHMGYMCLEPTLRKELDGIKLIELYAYLGFRCSGFPLDSVAISATLNVKYHMDQWMRDAGTWLDGAADFKHPTIPEVHRVMLIPKLRENYWPDQHAKFDAFYTSLKWDGEDSRKVA